MQSPLISSCASGPVCFTGNLPLEEFQMETADQIVQRKFVRPEIAKANLLKAAIEYADATKAAAKTSDDDPPKLERRL
jgi:hypothetical protein